VSPMGYGSTGLNTNTLKIGIPTVIVAEVSKMVWNRFWNPIQRVYKGVATTYFHADGLEQVVESYLKGGQGGYHNIFACQLPRNVVHGITNDLGMPNPH
jgi:hypothetical protein